VTQEVFAHKDPRFYPFLQSVYFHDNDISGGGKSPDGRSMKQMAAAMGGSLPDILYDGMVDATWGRKTENPGQVCLTNNGAATFLNFDAAGKMKHPGSDLKRYSCSLPALAEVLIPQVATGPDKGRAD